MNTKNKTTDLYNRQRKWSVGALTLKGGQASIHTFKMAMIVLMVVVVSYSSIAAVFIGYKIFTLPKAEKQILIQYPLMKINASLSPNNLDKAARFVTTYYDENGNEQKETIQLTIGTFNDHPHVKRYWVIATSKLKKWIKYGSLFVLLASIVTRFIFANIGHQLIKQVHYRGTRLVPDKELKTLVKQKNKSLKKTQPKENYTPYEIGGVEYVYGSEHTHTLLVGRTGSGKTQEIKKVIQQIRDKNDCGIILDITGSYIESHYDENKDIILNAKDARSLAWDFFQDCQSKENFMSAATTLIPDSKDPIWSTGARDIFVETTYKYFQQCNSENIKPDMDTWLNIILGGYDVLKDYLSDTDAASYFGQAKAMTDSFIGTISTGVKGLRAMVEYQHKDKELFSITNWLHNQEQSGFLFISSRMDQHETLKPLITLWTDIANRSLLSGPRRKDRLIWFILDELTALGQIPSLESGLTMSRQFGGAYLIGIQQISQLTDVYKIDKMRTICGNCSTKLIFSVQDPDTAEYMARTIGKAHTSNSEENISYGAQPVRDGRNIMKRKENEFVIMPEQIYELDNLTAYLVLSGDMPIALIKTKYIDWPQINKSFIEADAIAPEYKVPLSETLEKIKSNRSVPKVNSHKPDDSKKKKKKKKKPQSNKADQITLYEKIDNTPAKLTIAQRMAKNRKTKNDSNNPPKDDDLPPNQKIDPDDTSTPNFDNNEEDLKKEAQAKKLKLKKKKKKKKKKLKTDRREEVTSQEAVAKTIEDQSQDNSPIDTYMDFHL